MNFRMYIGANNKTKLVDYTMLRQLLAERFPNGYSISYGEGGWQEGKNLVVEDSCIVTVCNFTEPIEPIMKQLCSILEQKCIMLEELTSNFQFIGV